MQIDRTFCQESLENLYYEASQGSEAAANPKAPKAKAKVEESKQGFHSKEYVEFDRTESPKSTEHEQKESTRVIRCRAFPCIYEDVSEENLKIHWLLSYKSSRSWPKIVHYNCITMYETFEWLILRRSNTLNSHI